MATMTVAKPRPQVRGVDLPYDDGIPLESEWHVAAMGLLIDILRYHWRERRDIYVAGNLFVYFAPDQVKTRDFRGPDFFVVKGVRDNHMRHSWVVWEEDGLTPDYVIELASESTVKFDLNGKKSIYERTLKTPEYVVYDPNRERLRGWRLVRGRYEELAPNARGWLWSEELGLWLGVAAYRFINQTTAVKVLRFFDEDGELLPTPHEAEARRAEVEAQRAEAASQRAEAASQRAEAEAAARRAAEAEIARLRALLAQPGRE